MVSAGFVGGCDVQRAVDCARLALEVSESVDRLERAASGEDPEAFVDAADAVTGDIDELRGSVEDTDVREAADSVREAVDSVSGSFEEGVTVDLSPLGDAVGELTGACTS
jgi:hypothetical protein